MLLFFVFSVPVANGQNRAIISVANAISTSDFRWSIAGDKNGLNPNILSELKFDDVIRIGGIIEGQYNLFPYLIVNLSLGGYQTLNGSGTDIDYLEDNRNEKAYHLDFLSNKGKLETISIGTLTPLVRTNRISFSLGVSSILSKQVLFLNSDEIQKLNSSYSTGILGYGLAGFASFNLIRGYSIDFAVNTHRVYYKATGNWNLIDYFEHPVSFMHKSKGFNTDCKIKLKKNVIKKIDLFVKANYLFDKVGKGTDILYHKNGLRTITQFNGAKHTMAMLSLGCEFNLNSL